MVTPDGESHARGQPGQGIKMTNPPPQPFKSSTLPLITDITQVMTGKVRDAWLQWSHKIWYISLDINGASHSHPRSLRSLLFPLPSVPECQPPGPECLLLRVPLPLLPMGGGLHAPDRCEGQVPNRGLGTLWLLLRDLLHPMRQLPDCQWNREQEEDRAVRQRGWHPGGRGLWGQQPDQLSPGLPARSGLSSRSQPSPRSGLSPRNRVSPRNQPSTGISLPTGIRLPTGNYQPPSGARGAGHYPAASPCLQVLVWRI